MLFAISIAQSFGADQLKVQLLNAYHGAHYGNVVEYGEQLLRRSPGDYDTRYYLANAYVMTHRNEEAIKEYRLCLHNSKSEALRSYSAIALERLLKLKERALSSLSANTATAKNKEIRDFQKKVNTEAFHEKARLQSEWDQALAALNARQNSRDNFRRGSFNSGDWYRQRQEADNFQRERAQINQNFTQRMLDLSQYTDAMLTQANCGLSKIRLEPSLSSRRVKNYINFGDESEAANIPVDNPLRAQALPLDAAKVGPKKTIKKGSNTRKKTEVEAGAKTRQKPPAVAHTAVREAR
ncbi:MAG: hypothetical protein KGS72_04770 [Cyanobacteria bacterium REEB67]|nr:hypothetical protein [Cyanobacteria bacterium REEB67]